MQEIEDSEYYDEEEDDDEEDTDESEDGIPIDSEADAVEGIKIDTINLKDFSAELAMMTPPPCSEELVCLNFRRASINKQFRAKRISVDKLYCAPALFLNTD